MTKPAEAPRVRRMLPSWDVIEARARLRLAIHPILIDYAVSRAGDAWLDLWWRTKARRREWLERAVALLFGLILSWGVVEIVLRLPVPLPLDLGTKLFSCYDEYDVHQAVYFVEPRTKVYTFKPGYETTCHWNHLRWHHHGDQWGFRNPESWERVDIVLLGDSMTYGHGVEENATIAHFLREESGRRVANLGVTGGSPVEYVAYLRNFALRLHPKVVVVLVFANDFEDIAHKRTIIEQEAFAEREQAPELGIYDPWSLTRAGPDMKAVTFERVTRWTLAYQTWLFYEPVLRSWLRHPFRELTRYSSGEPRRPGADLHLQGVVEHQEDPLLEKIAAPPHTVAYAKRAFSVMARSSGAAGTRLVVGFLPELDPRDQTRDDVIEKVCAHIAASEGLPFLDLRPAVSGPDGRAFPGDRLLGDGHLTAQGSRRVATEVARFLGEQGHLGSR